MKIAFIKFCGLASGGIEKYLQTIAMLYKEEGHEVDYFYTNNCQFTDGHIHADNKEERKLIMQQAGINIIPVKVEQRIGGCDHVPWVNTDLFDLFNEQNYDFIFMATRGVEEYPFNQIKKTPIICTQHGDGVWLQSNVKKYVSICDWQAKRWISNGGDTGKMVTISPLIQMNSTTSNFREQFNLTNDTFVFGMHQRNGTGLFHPIALESYKKIESDKNYFIILGGEQRYRYYANNLGIRNIKFLDESGDPEIIHTFLNTLNVFTHCRSDGEVCSSALIEALYHGLPILSHFAGNMGHSDQINGNGLITNSVDEYSSEMLRLQENNQYYNQIRGAAKNKYEKYYDYNLLKFKYLSLLNIDS